MNQLTPRENIHAFMQTLENVYTQLSLHKGFLREEGLFQLNQILANMRRSLAAEDEASKLLRIGIVGSVKAGKSTFLNALLFNGQNILPKAATPMTASLTRLRYAQEQCAKLVFYSPEDWQDIESDAETAESMIAKKLAEARAHHANNLRNSSIHFNEERVRKSIIHELPPELAACRELKKTAEKEGLDVYSELEKGEQIIPFDNLSEIQAKLSEYIGSHGRLTPLVRHVELNLNHDVLRDIEIIDTPGLNDPVVSRSRETINFLCQCDCVMILSYAGEFLSKQDMDLIKHKLVNDGILHHTIIASKMDLAIQDHRGQKTFFKDAFMATRQNVVSTMKGRFDSQEPVLVSALLEGIAWKMEQQLTLSEEEQLTRDNLASFTNAPHEAKDFRSVAGLKRVRQELEQCREKKDQIKYSHQIDLIRGKKSELRNCLKNLETSALSDKETLSSVDLETLQSGMNALNQSVKKIDADIHVHFSTAELQMHREFERLKLRIIGLIDNYRELNVSSRSHDEDRSTTSGMFFWKKTHTRIVSVTEYQAEISDIINTLRRYTNNVGAEIITAYEHFTPLDTLKAQLKKHVLEAFHEADVTFSKETILGPLQISLDKLRITPPHYEPQAEIDSIVNKFGASVKNEDIAELKVALEKALDSISKKIRHTLDEQQASFIRTLHQQNDMFVGDISKSIQSNLDKLSAQYNDKQSNIAHYDETITRLRELRAELSHLEV
ncbi:TPA: dynamin family protein [Citrobacter werkmanii]